MTRGITALALATGLALILSSAASADPNLDPALPEVVLDSPVLLKKASDLGHDPVRIFEFVRNELDYQVYWGLMKGPEGTLVSGGGNDADLSSLLVSLLRISGVPARFVYGRIRIPSADAIAMTGAESRTAAHNYWRLAEPLAFYIQGVAGPLAAVVETSTDSILRYQVWVEAQVPLARYRGASGDPRGVAWVALDPASKLREVRSGISLPLETDPALRLDYLANGGIFLAPDERDVSEVLEDKIQAYLAINHAGSGLSDVPVLGQILPQRPGILPTALPYERDFSVPSFRGPNLDLASPALPSQAFRYVAGLVVCPETLAVDTCRDDGIADIRAQMASDGSFVPNPSILGVWWEPAAQTDGKRVTLSFPPSTGTLPDTGYETCPAVETQPTVMIDGILAMATASTVPACTDLNLIVVALPAYDAALGSAVWSPHLVPAGGTYLLHLDLHNGGPERTQALGMVVTELEDANSTGIPVRDDPNGVPYIDTSRDGNKDPGELFLAQDIAAQEKLIGAVQHLASSRYAERYERDWIRLAAYYHRLILRLPIIGLIKSNTVIDYLFDAPVGTRPSGLVIDVGGNQVFNVLRSGLLANPDRYAETLGHAGSESEHRIWEEIAAVEAVSTVRGMQLLGAFGEELISVKNGSEAVAAANCSGSTCADVDRTTFCELWSRWPTAGFPSNLNLLYGCGPAIGGTTHELRIAKNSKFLYRDWDGYVFWSDRTDPNGNRSHGYIIVPTGGVHASGGFANNALRNFPTVYSFDQQLAFGVITTPNQSFVDIAVANGSLQSADIAAASIAFDFNPTLLTTNSAVAVKPANLISDPVSVVTGDFHHVVTDIKVAGRGGFDLQVVRSYISRLAYDGPLGYGWIHTFDQHLRVDSGDVALLDDDKVIFVDETGAETTYFDKPAGFATEPWVRKALRREPSGSFVLTHKDGMEYHFLAPQNDIAKLDRMRDRNGNEIVCEYDLGTGDLLYVYDTTGDTNRRLAFSYAGGRLDSISDWTGRTWDYDVQGGQLTDYTDPYQVGLGAQGRSTKYEYLPSGQPNSALDHNLTKIIQPEDRDSSGEGDWQMAFTYWANDMVRSHTDSLNRTTFFDYNFLQKRTRVTYPDGTSEEFVFDRNGNVVRRVSPRGISRRVEFDPDVQEPTRLVDGFGAETLLRYDHRGNVTFRQDREGHSETFLYNTFSQPVRHVDRTGAETRLEYDSQGNLLREWRTLDGQLEQMQSFVYDSFGNMLEACNYAQPGAGAPACTKHEYDALGVAVIRQVDAEGVATRLTRDPLARVTRTEITRTLASGAPENVTTQTVYDELDRAVQVTGPTGVKQVTVFDANGLPKEVKTVYTDHGAANATTRVEAVHKYDKVDQLESTTNALMQRTEFKYDELGRVVETKSPGGRVSRREYDAGGNTVALIDPAGGRLERVFDAENRIIEVRQPSAVVFVGQPRTAVRGARVTRIAYDREGRPLSETQELHQDDGAILVLRTLRQTAYDEEGRPTEVRDAENHIAEIVWDELGRQRSVLTTKGVAGEEATTFFKYDLQGRLLERTDAEGRTSRIRYDRLGRVRETEDPLARVSAQRYDELGNLVERTSAAGDVVNYEFDARGLLVRRHDGNLVSDQYKYDALGRQLYAATSAHALSATYDELDRPISVSSPSFGTARRVYDADGFVQQVVYPLTGFPEKIVVGYLRDARGNLSGILDPRAGTWRFSYNEAGELTHRVDPNGFQQWREYTAEGFVAKVRYVAPPQPGGGANQLSLIEDLEYDNYDPLGNPHLIRSAGEGDTVLAYDERSQVTSALYPGGESETFGYDLVGNRVSHNNRLGVPLTYEIDAADQLTAIRHGPSNIVLETFQYDDAGRRIQRAVTQGDTTVYDYDGIGRLTHLDRTPDGAQNPNYFMDLAYDATGHRFTQFSTTGLNVYFGEWSEFRNGSTVRLVHGGGIDSIVAEVLPDAAGGTARTYMPDAAGNVTHFIDDGIVDPTAQRYEAFGGLRSGNAGATRAFAGRPYEGTTGLVNLRARHYDTATGRFLQTDPLGLSAVQAYAYARSNPFVYGDPLGLDPPAVGDKAPAPPPRAPSKTALEPGSRGPLDDHRPSGGIAEIVTDPAQSSQGLSLPSTSEDFGQLAIGVLEFGVGGREALLERAGRDAQGALRLTTSASNVLGMTLDLRQASRGFSDGAANPGDFEAGLLGLGLGLTAIVTQAPAVVAVGGALGILDAFGAPAAYFDSVGRLRLDLIRSCEGNAGCLSQLPQGF